MDQRVALVTGGASGIGEEVCRLLAEHHFFVAVCDIHRLAALASSAMSQVFRAFSLQHRDAQQSLERLILPTSMRAL